MSKEENIQHLVDHLNSPFIKALSDPVRLEILKVQLLHGEMDIGEISEHFKQDRSVISRHLNILLSAGIVSLRKFGRHSYYSIQGPTLIGKFQKLNSLLKKCHDSGCC